MAQIICKDLCVGYNGVPAAKDINFSIEKGGYLCITGENGSGKSTLIKTLLNLIKPISGHLEFGDGLTQNSIGYLPQNSELQKDFPASVREIVLSGFLGKKKVNAFYSKEEKKEVKETITNKDIAKAIASLNYKQLDELDAKIRYLSELKKNKKLILDKDIA